MERARIVFAIENEMSTAERDSPENKYWTNVDGERYLQVEEFDEKTFLKKGKGNAQVKEKEEDDQTNETKL